MEKYEELELQVITFEVDDVLARIDGSGDYYSATDPVGD